MLEITGLKMLVRNRNVDIFVYSIVISQNIFFFFLGIYEFTFEDGSKVKARYSFVYAYEDGKWMISHHHSSLMPQEVVRPAKITETEVRGLFDLWNNALHTGEPYTVAARYSKDAVLLPTLSDKARYTTDEIADYFVGFLRKKPDGKILEGNVKIGPNWAQDAGT